MLPFYSNQQKQQTNKIKVQQQNCAKTEKQTFKFISDDYSKHLTCKLCKSLMIKPMRIHPCGHTFCFKCINNLNLEKGKKKKSKQCPIQICSRVYIDTQKDLTAQSLIDELKVACTNQGCVWKGSYDNYKNTHKQACVLKNGLNTWLQQLTKGISIRPRQNAFQKQASQIKKQRTDNKSDYQGKQNSRNQQKSLNQSNLQKNKNQQIIQSLQTEKIQKQELISINQKLNQIANHSQQLQKQKVQNERDCKKEYLNIELSKQNVLTNKNMTNHVGQAKKDDKEIYKNTKNQKQTQKRQLNSQNLNQDTRKSRKSTSGNINLLSIPFGQSIHEQINQSQRKKDNYRKKQLKKLQGWS